MTEKEKNTVPTVEKSTPSEKEAPTLELPSKAELFKNPMKYIGVAIEQFQKMNERVSNVEKAVLMIADASDKQNEKLKPLIEFSERIKQMRSQSQNPQQPQMPIGGGGGIGEIIAQALPYVIGGGGQDSEMTSLMKEMMRANIDAIKADISFSKEIKGAVVSKIVGETMKK